MATGTKAPRATDEVVHEYPAIGRYRVRVIERTRPDGSTLGKCLDVREFVKAEKFEGFTRRGIRLTGKEDVETLRDIMADMAGRGWFEPPAKNDLLDDE